MCGSGASEGALLNDDIILYNVVLWVLIPSNRLLQITRWTSSAEAFIGQCYVAKALLNQKIQKATITLLNVASSASSIAPQASTPWNELSWHYFELPHQ